MDRHRLAPALLLAAVVFALALPVNVRRIAFPTDNDYSLHVLYAQRLAAGDIGDVPLAALAHPGLQLLLIALHLMSLGRLGYYASLIIVQSGTQAATAVLLYLWWGERQQSHWDRTRALWAGTLTVVSPIMALVPQDGQYYFGYIGLANYHNPTIHLLRPIALVSFALAPRVFTESRNAGRCVAAAAVLIALAGLVKPSFALVVLPALAVMALVESYRHRAVDWRMLLIGYFIPGVLTLTAQWIVGFWLARGEQAGILFRPFEVETAFSGNLGLKLLLSIAFPLAAAIAFFPRLARKRELQLGWLVLLFGAAQMYLLAEAGDRFFHGNFRWSAQIGLFLLFAATARELAWRAKDWAGERRWRLMAVYGVYLIHVAAGVLYYMHALISTSYA